MKFRCIALFALVSAPGLFAEVYVNNRPVPICPANNCSEPALQQTLDKFWGTNGVNAATGQTNAAEWRVTDTGGSFGSTMLIEWAGNAGINEFGMWSKADGAVPNLLPLFDGPAHGDAGDPDNRSGVSIHFTSKGGIVVGPTVGVSADGVRSWNLAVSPIDPNGFGFYLKNTTNNFVSYTADALNGGTPQALTYFYNGAGTGSWIIGFEDSAYSSSDKDYNDMVVNVTNLTAVPEPASIVLLGTCMLAAATVLRRRKLI